VNETHERIQETIAAHALNALDGADGAHADELIASHVPGCSECRALLDAFQAVSGDLALAAEPRTPPRFLYRRMKRELGLRATPWSNRGAAAVAALAVVASLGAWNAHLSSRVSKAERRQASATEVLAAVSHPQARRVSLSAEGKNSFAVSLAATYVPGHPALFLFGSMPDPQADRVYQVWLYRGTRIRSAGMFKPERGQVLLRLPVDPRAYNTLLITEEPSEGSLRPSRRHVVRGTLG
jgi:hypothetical protein